MSSVMRGSDRPGSKYLPRKGVSEIYVCYDAATTFHFVFMLDGFNVSAATDFGKRYRVVRDQSLIQKYLGDMDVLISPLRAVELIQIQAYDFAPLGLSFVGEPPGSMRIASIVRESWAGTTNLKTGSDFLLAVGSLPQTNAMGRERAEFPQKASKRFVPKVVPIWP